MSSIDHFKESKGFYLGLVLVLLFSLFPTILVLDVRHHYEITTKIGAIVAALLLTGYLLLVFTGTDRTFLKFILGILPMVLAGGVLFVWMANAADGGGLGAVAALMYLCIAMVAIMFLVVLDANRQRSFVSFLMFLIAGVSLYVIQVPQVNDIQKQRQTEQTENAQKSIQQGSYGTMEEGMKLCKSDSFCMLMLAKKSGTKEACSSIPVPHNMYCDMYFLELNAGESEMESYCKSYNNEIYKDWCWGYLATRTLDTKYCLLQSGDAQTFCIRHTKEMNDLISTIIATCKNSLPSSQVACWENVALTAEQTSYCQNISLESVRKDCESKVVKSLLIHRY